MAKRVALPNGAVVQIASGYGTAIPFTTISNAAPPLVNANAHGLTADDYVLVDSGWCELDGRGYKVGVTDVDTLTLKGADTTDTTFFPPGSGSGDLLPVSGWVDLPCITDSALNGGEPQSVTVACLQEKNESEIPNGYSAQSMQFTIAYDPKSASLPILKDLTKREARSMIRVIVPGMVELIYPGYISLSPAPTLTRGEVMTRVLTVRISEITEYPEV